MRFFIVLLFVFGCNVNHNHRIKGDVPKIEAETNNNFNIDVTVCDAFDDKARKRECIDRVLRILELELDDCLND